MTKIFNHYVKWLFTHFDCNIYTKYVTYKIVQNIIYVNLLFNAKDQKENPSMAYIRYGTKVLKVLYCFVDIYLY